MVANSRSTPARTGATALLNQVCQGLSGRLRRARYMIRGSMPRSLAQPGPTLLAVVGLVGVDRRLVALDEIVGRDAVVHIRGRHGRPADDPAALVDRGVRLVAEPAPAV